MSRHIAANTGCNLGCTYCYEEPDREMKQAQIDAEYDIDLIMERLEKWAREHPDMVPGLHGGEPLLMRDEHIEQIFQRIHELYEDEDGVRTHIQTNATLIEDHHIEMFKEYSVNVGISCDGPVELNDQREARAGGEDVTRNMTERTHDAIDKCIEEGVSLGIITVLHKTNAGTDEKLETLLDWIDYLNRNGVKGHYNPAIPYEDIQEDISLSDERLKEVYLQTWEWMKEEPYRMWGPFMDMQDNLVGNKLSNCVNQKCDVFNAGAARIIRGDGETTGCGKTWAAVGDGVPFLQGESTDNDYDRTTERYEMLKQTPGPFTEEVQEGEIEDQGGCKGCPYWNVCQGGCPSAGTNYDYRERSRTCKAMAATYAAIEHSMRSLMPGFTTITDLPWDADLADDAANRCLDIKPFAGMKPSDGTETSVYGGEHDHGTPVNRAAKRADSFDERAELYKEEYDPRILTIDPQNESIHADTAKLDGGDGQ